MKPTAIKPLSRMQLLLGRVKDQLLHDGDDLSQASPFLKAGERPSRPPQPSQSPQPKKPHLRLVKQAELWIGARKRCQYPFSAYTL
jgi:hypothetical protein